MIFPYLDVKYNLNSDVYKYFIQVTSHTLDNRKLNFNYEYFSKLY